jgi:hypothetical protein
MRRIGILGAMLLVLFALATVPAQAAQRVPSGGQEMEQLPKPPPPFRASPTYLGDFCWQFTVTENQSGPVVPLQSIVMRMSLTNMGGMSVSAQGIISPPGQNPVIFAGGGMFTGTDLILTISSTQDGSPDTWRIVGTWQFRLNTTTWSGTSFMVGSNFDTSTRTFSDKYRKGTLALTTCPQ